MCDSIERDERFDEVIDLLHGSIIVYGCTFSPSDVLAWCDPIAYRVYLADFLSDLDDEDEED